MRSWQWLKTSSLDIYLYGPEFRDVVLIQSLEEDGGGPAQSGSK